MTSAPAWGRHNGGMTQDTSAPEPADHDGEDSPPTETPPVVAEDGAAAAPGHEDDEALIALQEADPADAPDVAEALAAELAEDLEAAGGPPAEPTQLAVDIEDASDTTGR